MKRKSVRFSVIVISALVLAALGTPPAAHAATGPLCYVDIDATGGTNNGNSWANAYTSLQSALTDTNCTEIWVAEGLYKPGALQADSFLVTGGVAVYGGFAGTETVRTQRNWDTHVTVLSGDIDNNDTTDSLGVVQNYTDVTGSNSFHVVYMDGTTTPVTVTTVLDGFTVTAGKANGGYSYHDLGGGLYCFGAYSCTCSPTLSHDTFVGNYAENTGGAIYNLGSNSGASSPSIKYTKFQRNHAQQYGGAMYNHGGSGGTSSPTLLSVTFSYNSSGTSGGAMYNAGYFGTSSPSLTDVVFDHNSSPSGYGGAMDNWGEQGISSPTLLRVAFSSNSAANEGGAMINEGNNSGHSNPSLTDVTFYDNSANQGAGMFNNGYAGESSPSLLRVTFDHNDATTGYGGGIYNTGESSGVSSPTLANVTFSANSAGSGGGAMFNAAFSGTSSPMLTNVTFSGNSVSAGSGGAIYNLGGAGTANPTLTNVILWGDSASGSGDEIYNESATGTIDHSVVQGGCPSGSTCTTLVTTDPKLALLTDNGGFTKTMPVIWGSSAIDAGDDAACTAAPVNDLDQRGVPRPQGTHCDIGALERVPPGIRSDFESDGISDIAYFHAATGQWGILDSSENFAYSAPRYYSWGQTGDIIVPGDYDGDGRLDPTVRRPPAGGQSAAYLILESTTDYSYASSVVVPAGWPGLNDTPVPGDYNGDGISDPAIWRGNTGVWIIPLSPSFNTYQFFSWGTTGDTPIGADVDGDGQTDIGYWRPSTGVWGFLQSSQGYSYASPLFFSWGNSTDTAVMADYDADGKADPAVVIPPAGGQSKAYRILLSTLAYDPAQSVTVPAGWPGLNDTPVPADYDGDGKADAGIWRANTGIWIIPKSSMGNTSYMFAAWGANGDQVVK